MKALLLEESPAFLEAPEGADLDLALGWLSWYRNPGHFYPCDLSWKIQGQYHRFWSSDHSRGYFTGILTVLAHRTCYVTLKLLIKCFRHFQPYLGSKFRQRLLDHSRENSAEILTVFVHATSIMVHSSFIAKVLAFFGLYWGQNAGGEVAWPQQGKFCGNTGRFCSPNLSLYNLAFSAFAWPLHTPASPNVRLGDLTSKNSAGVLPIWSPNLSCWNKAI